MKTNLEQLVELDTQIHLKNKEIQAAKRLHVAPLQSELETIGERANTLWAVVLKEYGPGRAQDALHAAKLAAGYTTTEESK